MIDPWADEVLNHGIHIILLVINGILYTVTLKSSHHAWLAHDFCTIPWLSIDPHRFSQKFLHFDCPNSSATVGRPAAETLVRPGCWYLQKAPCESCIAVGDHPKNPENSPIQYLGSNASWEDGMPGMPGMRCLPILVPKETKKSKCMATYNPSRCKLENNRRIKQNSRESQDFVVPAAFNQ